MVLDLGIRGRSGKPREREHHAQRERERGRSVTVGGTAGAGMGAGGVFSRLRSITSTFGSFHGPVTL
jgi:hypothetical protein